MVAKHKTKKSVKKTTRKLGSPRWIVHVPRKSDDGKSFVRPVHPDTIVQLRFNDGHETGHESAWKYHFDSTVTHYRIIKRHELKPEVPTPHRGEDEMDLDVPAFLRKTQSLLVCVESGPVKFLGFTVRGKTVKTIRINYPENWIAVQGDMEVTFKEKAK